MPARFKLKAREAIPERNVERKKRLVYGVFENSSCLPRRLALIHMNKQSLLYFLTVRPRNEKDEPKKKKEKKSGIQIFLARISLQTITVNDPSISENLSMALVVQVIF